MKIIVFKGGIGNQIFQYALYNKLKGMGYTPKCLDCTISHNGLELNKYFDVNVCFANKSWSVVLRYLLKLYRRGIKIFISDESKFSTSLFNFYYMGYWQNKKWFPESFDIKFKSLILNDKNQSVLNQIKTTNSVSIHIRRGDYLTPENLKLFGDICSTSYYNDAIQYFKTEIKDPVFFVFSNDIQWAKDNLHIENAVYVDWNTGNDSIYDMFLMSKTKGNIIANSTFSFWGAYINKANKVVYPSKWFNGQNSAPDIFKDNWIAL